MWCHLGCKKLLLFWVLYSSAYGITPELVCLIVGLLVLEDIVIGVEPKSEATFLMHELVVECLALLWGIVEGLSLGEIVLRHVSV